MTQTYATYSNVKTRLNLPDDVDQTFITQLCTNANEYIEFYCRRAIGPGGGTAGGGTALGTATFDADNDVYAGKLYVRDGVRTISSLTVAPSTGDTAVSATVADTVILPRSQNRRPGWPGFWVIFKNVVTGSVSNWGTGQGNITMVYTQGWASVPAEVTEVAEIIVTRAWYARQAGQSDVVGGEDFGGPNVSRFISGRDRQTLNAYRPDMVAVG